MIAYPFRAVPQKFYPCSRLMYPSELRLYLELTQLVTHDGDTLPVSDKRLCERLGWPKSMLSRIRKALVSVEVIRKDQNHYHLIPSDAALGLLKARAQAKEAARHPKLSRVLRDGRKLKQNTV